MTNEAIDESRIALAVQQPWADLIVRGMKTIEVRLMNVRIRGVIYIYASTRTSRLLEAISAAGRFRMELESFPRGCVVGTVELVDSRAANPDDAKQAWVSPTVLAGKFAWRLSQPMVFQRPLPIQRPPFGIWFYPFRQERLANAQ